MGNNDQPTQQQQQQQSSSSYQQSAWYQKRSIPLGSCIGGIPIYLHWSFFALLLAMVLGTLISNPTDGKYWGIILLMYGPILLVTIIIHEFGHAFMTKSMGGQVGDMVLWPLGGFVICGPVESVIGDFKVAIAGPLTHLPQMILWLVIFVALEGGDMTNFTMSVDTENVSFGALLCAQAFYLNMILFVFNLFVPAYPLDGGRCLAAGLILAGLSVLKAATITSMVGMTFALAVAVWGIIGFFGGSPLALFTVAIGVWIFMSSYSLFKLTRPVHGSTSTSAVNEAMANDNLRTHPVFGQECYQNRASNNSNA